MHSALTVTAAILMTNRTAKFVLYQRKRLMSSLYMIQMA